MKIVYILPAFGEKPSDASYKKVAAAYRSAGYSVVQVPIIWERRTLTDWIKQATTVIEKNGPPDAIFGFSFGALIALILASRLPVAKLVLCSPSPYFAEDLAMLPPIAMRILGIRRMRDFMKYRAKEILPNVIAQVRIVVGGKDFPLLLKRVTRTVNLLTGAKMRVVEGAVHDIEDQDLLAACVDEVGK